MGMSTAVVVGELEQILVGNSCRVVEVGELGFLLLQTSEFGAVTTSLVGGGSEMVIVCGGCQGEVWFAIRVVMVIMTSDSAPMGVMHRFSTGEIIFVSS